MGPPGSPPTSRYSFLLLSGFSHDVKKWVASCQTVGGRLVILFGVQIIGDRSKHYGAFDCGPTPATAGKPGAATAQDIPSCSPSSGCC